MFITHNNKYYVQTVQRDNIFLSVAGQAIPGRSKSYYLDRTAK